MAGWYGLLDILHQQREAVEEWRDSEPVACPHDGTPLMQDPEGNLRCEFDGWIWDGTPEGKRGTA
jgi:hypothetical protein